MRKHLEIALMAVVAAATSAFLSTPISSIRNLRNQRGGR